MKEVAVYLVSGKITKSWVVFVQLSEWRELLLRWTQGRPVRSWRQLTPDAAESL